MAEENKSQEEQKPADAESSGEAKEAQASESHPEASAEGSDKDSSPADQNDNKELEKKYKDLLDKVEKMNAIELSELVKAIESRFGISASMPVAAAGGGDGEGATEKDSFNVVLKDAGSNKIQVIKAVKEITGLGLQEAKALVDGAPKPIKEGVKKEEAEELKKKLTEAGATVELE